MKLSYFKVIQQIIRNGHRITDSVSRELKEYAISEPQYNVLRVLKGSQGKPLNLQDISSKMVQRNSNVTRIIDKLLHRKLVERKECKTNRRKVEISITPLGLEQLRIFDQKVANIHHQYTHNLNAQELNELSRLLEKLFNNHHENN